MIKLDDCPGADRQGTWRQPGRANNVQLDRDPDSWPRPLARL